MSRRRGSGRVFVWVVLCGLMSSPAVAQIATGTLTGNVSDEAGGVIPGATVTATAGATNLTRTSVTNSGGRYTIQGLAPGSYQIRVELTGFRPLVREGIRLATGETVRLDVQLAVGGLSEELLVEGRRPAAAQ